MGKPVPKTTTAKATSETCPYVNTEEFIEDKYPVDGRYAVSIDCRVAQNGFLTVRPRKMLRNRGFETVEAFLACDGSWARAARRLHVHVDTVHYRIERAAELLGRDLSQLGDRLDLLAALRC
ncbi:helix-turn-helix domain-containing protein [Amycolatopsis sp. NPDC050768]|uniref:helix-turn-helix domain-containing protein n=1 Tax=Amycolatopsis sp. NPDC050768 TaxID=3154839 RepID=UPI0033E62AF1